MSHFPDAAVAGDTETLENEHLRLDVHERPTGWGWGELFLKRGDGPEYVGAIEHLGEADLGGFPHRLRLSADECDREDGALTFEVTVQEVNDAEQYMADESPLEGTVRLSLREDEPLVDLAYEIETTCSVELRHLRGPWLRLGAGAETFGPGRDDAIFPGIDWAAGDEQSSGTDFFEHPDARRVTPHPNRVGAPVMAASDDGVGVGLSWDAETVDLCGMPHVRHPQPVFASPNFVDRRDDSLLGLMLPSAAWELEEHELAADPPVDVGGGQTFALDATVSVVTGSSLDVVTDWVQREGLPETREPRYDLEAAVEWLAECYDTNLWTEGEGFGVEVGVLGGPNPNVPSFVETYVDREDDELAASLAEKVAWCEDAQADDEADDGEDDEAESENLYARPLATAIGADEETLVDVAETMLSIKTDGGAIPYDPDERHAAFTEDWSSYWRPLAEPGDSEIGLCAPAAAALLLAGEETGEDDYVDAGLEILAYAERFEKPAGDDWWETPLHGPNLFAAGKAAIAYELAYDVTGEDDYRDEARYWLRSLLPFTHLWEPHDVRAVYNTKPCLVSTAWYLSNWTDMFVQWEVLSVFAMSDGLDIDWTAVDPAIDWAQFREGVTVAALDWLIDSRDDDLLYEFMFDREKLAAGAFDGVYADVFEPVEGWYGGGPIYPDEIGENAYAILDER